MLIIARRTAPERESACSWPAEGRPLGPGWAGRRIGPDFPGGGGSSTNSYFLKYKGGALPRRPSSAVEQRLTSGIVPSGRRGRTGRPTSDRYTAGGHFPAGGRHVGGTECFLLLILSGTYHGSRCRQQSHQIRVILSHRLKIVPLFCVAPRKLFSSFLLD